MSTSALRELVNGGALRRVSVRPGPAGSIVAILIDRFAFDFRESVPELTAGAPIEFRGIAAGEIAAIHTCFDRAHLADAERALQTRVTKAGAFLPDIRDVCHNFRPWHHYMHLPAAGNS